MSFSFVNEVRFEFDDQDAIGNLSVCDHGDKVSLSATWYSKGAGFSIYFPKGPVCIQKLEKLVKALKTSQCRSCGQDLPESS